MEEVSQSWNCLCHTFPIEFCTIDLLHREKFKTLVFQLVCRQLVRTSLTTYSYLLTQSSLIAQHF